jgi:hypothetical protein
MSAPACMLNCTPRCGVGCSCYRAEGQPVSLSAVLNSASANPALAAVTTSIAEARLTVIRPSGP